MSGGAENEKPNPGYATGSFTPTAGTPTWTCWVDSWGGLPFPESLVVQELRAAIPALDTKVVCPAGREDFTTMMAGEGHCFRTRGAISSVVQHLNDRHLWSRERIADWLDTLDVDLTFPVPEKIEDASDVPVA